ncbi:lethal(3)malignant brain tumor-like protein 3 isoform X3 [Belonocnema kinseyi]|uniref:lethal(3)malignant brain tumor-like protein 3 isoform X3 n=1 Tax=Belonocnema kinseyi TaxID=2817044 RepID=UPI00143D5B48|nr:lethal(3)malignant brain tumor-like protein 3 isoform X3 [Belonocnema kinseyi]
MSISLATMEEEIIVDDIDDNDIGLYPTENAPSHISPTTTTLFIPHGKFRAGHTTIGNQTMVSSSASQLATIIHPNQIVGGQNKVYFQGPSQVATSQKGPHIVIHRPITSVAATNNQGQKHILVRRSNTPTAQIVPLNTSQGSQTHAQAGKHTFAYLGTIIKPNKTRESVVIPAGGLTTQISKPKLVITPVLSQLNPTSTSSPVGTQSRLKKSMANLLLPVNIPQQTSSAKPNMLNIKINNGQIGTESKGTITVLRESKTTNSTTHPPPLHPITNIGTLGKGGRQELLSDSIKISENPDSAVITPIPNKKEDINPPEKRKKTISNILRGSGEKRMKKQSFPKSAQEVDISYSISSPDSEQDKDKKMQNDDDITLIKVVPSEDKSAKLKSAPDDDIKVEIIKTSNNEDADNNSSDSKIETKIIKQEESKDSINSSNQAADHNFDATKALNWKDGVGSLPGSSLKLFLQSALNHNVRISQFCVNEFGLMEVVDEDENNKQDKENGTGDKENVCLSQNSSKGSPVSVIVEKKNEDRKNRALPTDTFYCCESCGCHGLAAEFESPISCSPSCTEVIEAKKQMLIRKDKDLKEMRAKRKRKKMLHEQNKTKDVDEKSNDKSQDKIKYETDEDSKDTVSAIDEESQGEISESKYPWQTGKLGFSWAKYLEHTKAKAAPVKLFKDPFPYTKNQFKVGMKLEGIDPEHPSRYCVLSVVEVVGYRIRLHFDGYAENYDFWVNADSMDIFPVGWAEKNKHRLDPPKGYVANNFNWNAYLKTCKANAAPKNIFSNKNSLFPTGFRVGMKLEAVDRKHSSLVCVASIAGLMDSRILVHFDSWDEVYDYWADASSPYIHPVGWCHHNGHSLTPPNSYKDSKSFTWDSYLRETQSTAAPARAFKQRSPCGFKRGMKLEAVDKRVPQMIRVATIEDVKDHMLKIRFDGWPENHAYWVDDDSTDIHPMGWCLKTAHPLEPPLMPDNLSDRAECGTHGCRGIGHIKGPKFATHNAASGCPYSQQNLQKIRIMSDRLNGKHDICEYEDDFLEKPKVEKTDKIKTERSDKDEKFIFDANKAFKFDKDAIKQEDVDSDKNEKSETSERSSKYRQMNSDGQTDDEEPTKKRKKKRHNSEEHAFSRSNSGMGDSSVNYTPNIPDKQLRLELYHSVYNPGYNPRPDAPHIWAKHSGALNRVVAKQTGNPRRWSNEEVIKFIQNLPNCKDIGPIFRKNSIDGEAFLMLTQEDLIKLLGLRLGPAIKLYNSIVLLRRKST